MRSVTGADGAAVGRGQDLDQRLAGRDRAVQPAEFGDDLGAAAAGRDHRRWPRRPSRTSPGELLPTGFFIDYSGQSRLEKEQGNTILIAFGLAVIVIYLVLAAQFESFRDPLIIMMSVPLSIFGAIVPLNLGLGTLNIYTQVGLITLIGLITKHGILMVEFANQQREQHGMRRRDAIIASAKVRLRPILMTTAAMALGVVPLIIAQRRRRRGALLDGPGDLLRHPGRHDVHALRGADVLYLHRLQRICRSMRRSRIRSLMPALAD